MKKFVSILLAAVLLAATLTAFAVSAWAEETGSESANPKAGKLALAMGADIEEHDSFSAAIRGFVSPELVEKGIKIATLELVDGKVSIKIEEEIETAGSAWVKGSKKTEVLVQVQWKPSLTGTDWTSLGDPFTVTVGQMTELDISNLISNEGSAYFSVKVYKGNGTGSVLSEGDPAVIAGIAGLAVVCLAAAVIFKKKKKTAPAKGAESSGEE